MEEPPSTADVSAPREHTPVHEQLASDGDRYLSLRELARYSGLSERTLRGFLSDPVRPLGCYRPNGRVLVKRSEFDAWMQAYRCEGDADVQRAVSKVMEGLSA